MFDSIWLYATNILFIAINSIGHKFQKAHMTYVIDIIQQIADALEKVCN